MSSDENISRRELLRGRFLASMFDALADRAAEALDAPDAEHVEDEHTRARPTPQRYPQTLDDVRAAQTSRRRPTIPVLRPPGAVDEPTFLAECTRCDACLEACPHDAIVHAPPRLREAAGTPMIDPMRQPCWLCDDRPCIESCEPGVLTRAVPTLMGTARINEETCLAHTGSFCTVCSEQCPVDGAIALDDNKRPTVVEQTCTGCGVCQYVCPAPHNAVLLMPAFQRPGRPGNQQPSEPRP